jgi:hypothetical protein
VSNELKNFGELAKNIGVSFEWKKIVEDILIKLCESNDAKPILCLRFFPNNFYRWMIDFDYRIDVKIKKSKSFEKIKQTPKS